MIQLSKITNGGCNKGQAFIMALLCMIMTRDDKSDERSPFTGV